MKKIGVIDLFCGVGGLSHGFLRRGFNVIAGFDIDKTCQYAYEINNHEPSPKSPFSHPITQVFLRCENRIIRTGV